MEIKTETPISSDNQIPTPIPDTGAPPTPTPSAATPAEINTANTDTSMQPPVINTNSSSTSSQNLPEMATFWQRLTAVLLDLVVLVILNMIFGAVIKNSPELMKVLTLLINLGYTFGFLTSKGQTVGKIILNIKIVKEKDYGKLTFLDVLLREYIGKVLSAIPLLAGYGSFFLSNTRQTWHDKIAGTLVVKLDSNKQIISSGKQYEKKIGGFIGVLLLAGLPIILSIILSILVVIGMMSAAHSGEFDVEEFDKMIKDNEIEMDYDYDFDY